MEMLNVKVNGIVDYAETAVGNKYAYFMGWFMEKMKN